MDFELQLTDGTWVEAKALPVNPKDYKKAVVLDGTNEALTLVPIMDNTSTYRWAVK